jgi:medium-chain acyl-[acyl-carrier-protein] hydrolase
VTVVPVGSPWLLRLKKATVQPALALICLPYAGGNPALFRTWVDRMDEDIDLVAVRLPGRGARLGEPSCADWPTLLTNILDALAPFLDRPHAFFGHSFGGRLAYELACLAARRNPGRTQHLFVSGCRSPNEPRRPYLHGLSETDFRLAVREMGGLPDELLANEPLMRLLSPAVRNDIRLAELWDDREPVPLAVPITVCYGRDDRLDSGPAMRGWPAFGTRECELVELPGGHFFLDTHRRELLDVITDRLGRIRCAR